MKILVVLACLVAVGYCGKAVNPKDEFCFDDVQGNCKSGNQAISCNSVYGNFKELNDQFSELGNDFMAKNFEYLKLYIHFSSYLMHREGFAAKFKALADYKWSLTKNTISYITERGGIMEFCKPCICCETTCSLETCKCQNDCDYCRINKHSRLVEIDAEGGNPDGYDIGELPSLALAVDNEKATCLIADELHRIAVSADTHDIQSAQFTMSAYLRPHRKILRNLVGFENELAQMLTHNDQMISYQRMDQYLWWCNIFD